jgi:AcrR family transcriptional regulator
MARKRALTRERILRTALRLADEGGIESLSMRKLARELGVEAMSLYNHVANKAEVVDGIVDIALSEIELPGGDEEWDDAIRTCAVSAHEAFLRHPWACSLVMSGPQGGRPLLESPRVAYIEWMLGRLRRAGFSADLTYHAYHALDSHILGFTLWQLGHSGGVRNLAGDKDIAEVVDGLMQELRERGYEHLLEHGQQHLAAPPDDGARQFAFGLDLILDGLRRARARV